MLVDNEGREVERQRKGMGSGELGKDYISRIQVRVRWGKGMGEEVCVGTGKGLLKDEEKKMKKKIVGQFEKDLRENERLYTVLV